MRAHEAGTTCNKDAFSSGRGEKFHRGESRERGIRYRMGVGVEDRLGLIGRMPLSEPSMLLCLFVVEVVGVVYLVLMYTYNIVCAEVQGPQNVYGDLTIEPETIKSNGLYFLSSLIAGADLEGKVSEKVYRDV
jgi:hypothetical protein